MLLFKPHCPVTAVSPVVAEKVRKGIVDWHMPHVEGQAFLLGCRHQIDWGTKNERMSGLLSLVAVSNW